MARRALLHGIPFALVTAVVESARRDWDEGHRRLLDAAREQAAASRLYPQVEAVTDALRRRIGGTFTVAELAAVYATSEPWARDALAEQGAPGWPRTLTMVVDAAFHLVSRGASDYEP
jgi:hypothetical protein